jgi:hypothetical protein
VIENHDFTSGMAKGDLMIVELKNHDVEIWLRSMVYRIEILN